LSRGFLKKIAIFFVSPFNTKNIVKSIDLLANLCYNDEKSPKEAFYEPQ
jgi:hypothetical protein